MFKRTFFTNDLKKNTTNYKFLKTDKFINIKNLKSRRREPKWQSR